MTQLPKPEAVIFDLDGTLFQTETLLETVHVRLFDTLFREGLYPKPVPPVQRLLGSLGMLLEDIWKRVMPDGSPEAHARANVLLLQYELEELAQGRGKLFPGVPETLAALQAEGIRLFVASNGLEPYVRGVVQAQGIAGFFEDLYSAGQYGTESKAELVRLLLDTYGLRHAWMAGDRSSDVEAGKANGLSVIGCGYAKFGREDELEGSDAVIRSFPELLDLLPR